MYMSSLWKEYRKLAGVPLVAQGIGTIPEQHFAIQSGACNVRCLKLVLCAALFTEHPRCRLIVPLVAGPTSGQSRKHCHTHTMHGLLDCTAPVLDIGLQKY